MYRFHLGISVATGVALVALAPALLNAQIGSQKLPEGWADLPPAQFVAEVKNRLSGGGQSSPDLEKAIASHAAKLLLTTNVVETATPVVVPLLLYEFCSDRLTVSQKATVAAKLAQLAGSSDDPSSMSYLQLRSRLALMYIQSAPLAKRSAAIASWIDADTGNLATVPLADLPFLAEQAAYPEVDGANFSVEWTGFVTAPETGQYRFSITPLNPNTEHNQYFIRETMSVSIGGQEVLRAAPESWTTESSPVHLTAGKPAALRVQVAFDCSSIPHYDLHVSLRWKGPGIAESLVPPSAFSPLSGEGKGLRSAYQVSVDGNKYTEIRVEPMIDCSWLYLKTLVPQYSATLARIGARLWDLGTDADYLARCEQETASQHPLLYQARSSELLSSPQRASFARKVLTRPNLLQPLPLRKMVWFYAAYRIGARDEAIDLLGKWCQMHPDAEPYFPVRPSTRAFFKTNRDLYRFLTVYLVWQYPPHIERLQQQYLVLPEGGCCLPVAYTLSYGHLVQGKLPEWIELLDAKLRDTQLTGDRRINWLLARAQAEEIRHSRPARHLVSKEELLAGRGWIEEANLVAQCETSKLRTLKELVVRTASLNEPKTADILIDQAEHRMSSPAATAALASWRAQIRRLEAERRRRSEANREFAQDAYLKTLQERLQRARRRSEDAAVARYEAMIKAAENRRNKDRSP